MGLFDRPGKGPPSTDKPKIQPQLTPEELGDKALIEGALSAPGVINTVKERVEEFSGKKGLAGAGAAITAALAMGISNNSKDGENALLNLSSKARVFIVGAVSETKRLLAKEIPLEQEKQVIKQGWGWFIRQLRLKADEPREKDERTGEEGEAGGADRLAYIVYRNLFKRIDEATVKPSETVRDALGLAQGIGGVHYEGPHVDYQHGVEGIDVTLAAILFTKWKHLVESERYLMDLYKEGKIDLATIGGYEHLEQIYTEAEKTPEVLDALAVVPNQKTLEVIRTNNPDAVIQLWVDGKSRFIPVSQITEIINDTGEDSEKLVALSMCLAQARSQETGPLSQKVPDQNVALRIGFTSGKNPPPSDGLKEWTIVEVLVGNTLIPTRISSQTVHLKSDAGHVIDNMEKTMKEASTLIKQGLEKCGATSLPPETTMYLSLQDEARELLRGPDLRHFGRFDAHELTVMNLVGQFNHLSPKAIIEFLQLVNNSRYGVPATAYNCVKTVLGRISLISAMAGPPDDLKKIIDFFKDPTSSEDFPRELLGQLGKYSQDRSKQIREVKQGHPSIYTKLLLAVGDLREKISTFVSKIDANTRAICFCPAQFSSVNGPNGTILQPAIGPRDTFQSIALTETEDDDGNKSLVMHFRGMKGALKLWVKEKTGELSPPEKEQELFTQIAEDGLRLVKAVNAYLLLDAVEKGAGQIATQGKDGKIVLIRPKDLPSKTDLAISNPEALEKNWQKIVKQINDERNHHETDISPQEYQAYLTVLSDTDLRLPEGILRVEAMLVHLTTKLKEGDTRDTEAMLKRANLLKDGDPAIQNKLEILKRLIATADPKSKNFIRQFTAAVYTATTFVAKEPSPPIAN